MGNTRLLLDGYNVLFQSQMVGSNRGMGWLPKARERLLRLLVARLSHENQSRTVVVFDAAKFGETPPDFFFEKRIAVRFAIEHAEADDLLEVLIRRAPQPKLLCVVSSDLRIRRCAKARRAKSVDAESFLNQLEEGRGDALVHGELPTSEVGDDAPGTDTLAPDEVDYWLREFDQ